ncbi:F-box protein interaction domain protein [Senna tora]|uniref:F-box protein interaction domain protein n=1 Tax=Senna tora TaxID=362788 RepID=A0A834TZW8_9FABA|nr:F-box protein interaction domain protein [Senna tora]
MGFHDSSEISIDRLMSYAGKMAHLFYNSYKAWYSKIIEDGYMIEDNEWTRLHATSKLGLELVAWKQKWQRKGSLAEKAEQKPDLGSGGMIVAWNERTNISIMDVSHHWIHLKGKDIKDSNVKALPIVASDHAPLIYSSYFDMPQRYRPCRLKIKKRKGWLGIHCTNGLCKLITIFWPGEQWKFMKSMIFFFWKSLVYPTSKIPNFSILNLPATAKELRLNDEKKGFDQPLGYYGCWTLFAFLHHLLSVMIQNYSLWIAMKRKTDSVAIEADEVDDLEIQPLSPSFLDLPSPITTNILLRLPIKSVLICKCVCKCWHTIISDPHFAKLHFKDAPADVMIRTNDPKRVSRTLHLLEFQPKQFIGRSNYDNGSRFCICDDFCKPNCKRHIKFEAKFKLPLRDSKMVLDKMLEAKSRKRSYIACKPRDDKFDVLNSCKGLLCLCGPMDRNPLVVCNPVTGEFIRLPEGSKIFREAIDCGFGYHEKTREFKVIRVFNSFARDPKNAKNWLYNGRVAEMHTLGTGSWKNVELVVRFNFELERFEEFPCPVKNFGMTNRDNKYGVKDSWTKIYNIDMECSRWPFGLYRPIKLFNKGSAVLMYHSCNCLIYHERRRHGFNFLKVRGTEFKFEAFAHIPSLISLKDAVKGDVEVQNVHSRCSAFKLREENDVLFLAEESVQLEKLYSSSEDDDEDSS